MIIKGWIWKNITCDSMAYGITPVNENLGGNKIQVLDLEVIKETEKAIQVRLGAVKDFETKSYADYRVSTYFSTNEAPRHSWVTWLPKSAIL